MEGERAVTDGVNRSFALLAKLLGGVEHEVLYHQATEVFGWLCEGDFEYVSEELSQAPSHGTDQVERI